LVFDDTKGSELIRIHAEKDMETTIENNDDQTVKNDRTITVQGTHNETIYGPMSIESYASIELKVGASKITMTPASISISSPVITVTADASLTETSPLTTITGSVTLTLLTNVIMARLNGGTPVIMP
jgi:type VI secretion system secreted protein VgrG